MAKKLKVKEVQEAPVPVAPMIEKLPEEASHSEVLAVIRKLNEVIDRVN